jgi:hypothetical protein
MVCDFYRISAMYIRVFEQEGVVSKDDVWI